MASRINYSGLRPAQKRNEPSHNLAEPSTTSSTNPHEPHTTVQTPQNDPKPRNMKKKGNGDPLDVYQGNFHADNLEYINLLLKNKTSSNKEKNPAVPKKKGHFRLKSTFVESAQEESQQNVSEMQRNSEKAAELAPIIDENSKAPSMRPDDDDGFQVVEVEDARVEVNIRQRQGGENFYEGDDTHRQLNDTPTREEEKLFERFFKEDTGIRRSMSLEDLRINKKDFSKNHNNSTMHHPAEMPSYSMDKSAEASIYHDSKQNRSEHKGDFMQNLTSYIDYFHKSDNTSYRNMKAGQYFRGNTGKSHRSMQKDLETSNHELRVCKLQMEKMKDKINELMIGNKMLTKELKMAHAREEEQQQVFYQMEEQIIKLTQKNTQYKTKYAHVQEQLKQERAENEMNLFSLKKILANNINLALEHRPSPYINSSKERSSQLKAPMDSVYLKKDKGTKSNLKEKKKLNGTVEAYGSTYETGNYRRSRENRETPKRETSALFSQKGSLSSDEEERQEGYSNPFSSSIDYESYEGDEYQYANPYQDSYRQEITRNQQIKMLQEKLTELMSSEEVSFSAQNAFLKSANKTNRSKQGPHHKRQATAIPNHYISTRERQGSLPRQTNLSAKYKPNERHSKIMRNDYEENPSLNDVSEASYSLHNSD